MHVPSVTQRKNQVMNFKFRQWISSGSSEAGAGKKSIDAGYTETTNSAFTSTKYKTNE